MMHVCLHEFHSPVEKTVQHHASPSRSLLHIIVRSSSGQKANASLPHGSSGTPWRNTWLLTSRFLPTAKGGPLELSLFRSRNIPLPLHLAAKSGSKSERRPSTFLR